MFTRLLAQKEALLFVELLHDLQQIDYTKLKTVEEAEMFEKIAEVRLGKPTSAMLLRLPARFIRIGKSCTLSNKKRKLFRAGLLARHQMEGIN